VIADEITSKELRRRHRNTHLKVEKDREFRCAICNARCTQALGGVEEYGHLGDCPRRTDHLPRSGRKMRQDGDSHALAADGGVICYDCPEHGEISGCNVDDAGQRRCPDCGNAFTAIITDGGEEETIEVGGHEVYPDQVSVLPCPDCGDRRDCYYLGSRNSLTAGDEPRSFAVSGWVCSECESTLEVTDEKMMGDDDLTERDIILGERGGDEYEERVVMNPEDPEEVSGHLDQDGFTATRFGAGALVDIHIPCDECNVSYIIEDVPKDKAENPGKYVGDQEGDR
jgi:hypothetical protein